MSRECEILVRLNAQINQAIDELGLAEVELARVRQELAELEARAGRKLKVTRVVENRRRERICVVEEADGKVELMATKPESAKETINQVKQVYARIRVLEEVKRQGYQQVKEEKLPDGSLRLVVQRWQ